MTATYNPLKETLPQDIEFALVTASFVERNGFVTITDPIEIKEKNLPRWITSTERYRIDTNGYLWARHFTQDRFTLRYDSVQKLISAWEAHQVFYLSRNGCSLEDVSD